MAHRLTEEEQQDYEKRRKAAEDAGQQALPYKWRQALGDVDVTVLVPQGTRGKDLIVEIKKSSLKVSLKGKPSIIEGKLSQEIKLEDSTWTLGLSPSWSGDFQLD